MKTIASMRVVIAFAIAPLCSSCEIANFAMNVADRKDIQNLFRWHYMEEVIRLQRENVEHVAKGMPERAIPTFREWTKNIYRDRVTYATYIDTSLMNPRENPRPLTFDVWCSIEPDKRPKAKRPEPDSAP